MPPDLSSWDFTDPVFLAPGFEGPEPDVLYIAWAAAARWEKAGVTPEQYVSLLEWQQQAKRPPTRKAEKLRAKVASELEALAATLLKRSPNTLMRDARLIRKRVQYLADLLMQVEKEALPGRATHPLPASLNDDFALVIDLLGKASMRGLNIDARHSLLAHARSLLVGSHDRLSYFVLHRARRGSRGGKTAHLSVFAESIGVSPVVAARLLENGWHGHAGEDHATTRDDTRSLFDREKSLVAAIRVAASRRRGKTRPTRG